MLTSCMPVCERSMPWADKYRSAHLEPKRKLIKERANYCAGYLHNLDDNLENTVISQRFMTLIRLQGTRITLIKSGWCAQVRGTQVSTYTWPRVPSMQVLSASLRNAGQWIRAIVWHPEINQGSCLNVEPDEPITLLTKACSRKIKEYSLVKAYWVGTRSKWNTFIAAKP